MEPIQLPSSTNSLLTVSKAHEHVWVIELHHGVDNRLTEQFCRDALIPALDIVESQWRNAWRKAFFDKTDTEKVNGHGALIIVSNRKQQKFFCNGFDYQQVLKKPYFITNTWNPVMIRLLSFPIPVIAAINGHAFAAGFVLALSCDYRVMKAQKAWVSMNEILFGGILPLSFTSILNKKTTDSTLVRKVFLEAHRFTAQEALEAKLVDEIAEGDSNAVFEAALQRALKLAPLSRLGVYGLIKKSLHGDIIKESMDNPRPIFAPEEDDEFQRYIKAKL